MEASNARSRMTSLFNGNNGSGGNSNEALRYSAPKESTMRRTSTSSTPSTATTPSTTSTPSSTVLTSGTVQLFRYNSSSKSYVPAENGGPVGVAIVGSGITYHCMCYNSQKAQLAVASIGPTSKATLQPKGYINFYDDSKANWSMKFQTDAEAEIFMKSWGLVTLHVAIWEKKAAWANATKPLLLLDIGLGGGSETNGTAAASNVSTGDTVGVSFSAWRIVGSESANPLDLISKYAPFESCSRDDFRKFKVGDNQERFKALDAGVVGMRRGMKRLIVSPPKLSTEWLLFEVEVVKTKTRKAVSQEQAPPTQQHAPSRRPSNVSVASSSAADERSTAAQFLVPYDPAPGSSGEMDFRQQQLMREQEELRAQRKAVDDARQQMLQDQLELQRKQLEDEQRQFYSSKQAAAPPAAQFYAPPQHQQQLSYMPPQSQVVASSSPAVLVEIQSKMDHVIQMLAKLDDKSSTKSSSSNMSTKAAMTCAIQAIEQLGAENDRYVSDFSEKNHQMHSLETRVSKLSLESSSTAEENRRLSDQIASLKLQQLSQTESLANALADKEKALYNVSRLEAEIGHLKSGDGSAQLITAELQGRLETEVQSRTLAEQQLLLMEKQRENEKNVLIAEMESKSQNHVAALTQTIAKLESDIKEAQSSSQNAVDEKVGVLEEQIREMTETSLSLKQVAEAKELEVLKIREEEGARTATALETQAAEYEAKLSAAALKESNNEKDNENTDELVIEMFKTAMNEAYRSLQEAFDVEGNVTFSSEEVLDNVRKVLRKCTKDVANK